MRQFLIPVVTSTIVAVSILPIHASSFSVESKQFENGGTLPQSTIYQGFGCTGDNMSPQLSWQNAPKNTKSYVVTLFDPDAPTGVGWWHWTVFNIPADVNVLAVNAGSSNNNLPPGSVQGYTDFGSNRYGGACPPIGDQPHDYIFTIYALDVKNLPADKTTTGAKLAFLIKDHILAKAAITAKFGR
ncbi:MAG: YbhB/YbcL family Raf kinase inhibitor-like protein [Waterburya sp.]